MKLLIDKQQLYEILKEFNVITGLKVSFVEDYNSPILSVPGDNCRLCLKKQNEDYNFYLRCKECDKSSMEIAQSSGDVYIYECHYHLHEAVVPVKIYGNIVGYFVLGQMLVDRDKFLSENNPTEEELELLSQIANPTPDVLNSCTKMLFLIAKYCILSNNINFIQKEDFIVISDFIKNNLSQDLSVDMLCKKFHFARSTLYALFDRECNMGVTEYINHIRLETSLELLKKNRVKEVAQLVGIPDSNYFSRLFKQTYGLSPANYIKKLKS